MVYDCVISGSGFVSFGYAKSHKNTLITEESELCDKYFGGCFNCGTSWDYVPHTENGIKLKAEFEKYELLYGDKADVSALETVFCNHIADCPPDILMLTSIAGIEKNGELYKLTLFNNDGFSQILTKKLIINSPLSNKKYTAIRFFADLKQVKSVFNNSISCEGFHKGDVYAYIPALSDSLAAEHMRITDEWCEKSNGGKLVYIAPQFRFFGSKKTIVKNEITYVDESAFKNAIEAYEFGGDLL